jgi:2-polyprenyl-3-methyl-5-hydroxy-6-metoxy-1,4-benzoquinol methylase
MKPKVINDPQYGYLRLDPIPTQDEVEKFYAEEFYAANASYYNNSALNIQKEQADFFNSRWESIYQVSKTFFQGNLDGKTVFDIGFGFAQAILYLKSKGLEVTGLEPSLDGVNYAKENGIEAYHADIENFDIVNSKKFDIVLLLNVLEHLRQPAETLLNIKKQLLHPKGLLVIDVPNDFNLFQTIANAEYGLDEWWVVAPNHINYFSPSSLMKLLEDCGYAIFDYEASFPLDMFLLFGDQYIGNGTLGRECHNKRVNFETLMRKHGKQNELKALYKSFADLNLGRTITIYATPKD